MWGEPREHVEGAKPEERTEARKINELCERGVITSELASHTPRWLTAEQIEEVANIINRAIGEAREEYERTGDRAKAHEKLMDNFFGKEYDWSYQPPHILPPYGLIRKWRDCNIDLEGWSFVELPGQKGEYSPEEQRSFEEETKSRFLEFAEITTNEEELKEAFIRAASGIEYGQTTIERGNPWVWLECMQFFALKSLMGDLNGKSILDVGGWTGSDDMGFFGPSSDTSSLYQISRRVRSNEGEMRMTIVDLRVPENQAYGDYEKLKMDVSEANEVLRDRRYDMITGFAFFGEPTWAYTLSKYEMLNISSEPEVVREEEKKILSGLVSILRPGGIMFFACREKPFLKKEDFEGLDLVMYERDLSKLESDESRWWSFRASPNNFLYIARKKGKSVA